jgi:hypothetical protein
MTPATSSGVDHAARRVAFQDMLPGHDALSARLAEPDRFGVLLKRPQSQWRMAFHTLAGRTTLMLLTPHGRSASVIAQKNPGGLVHAHESPFGTHR